MFKYGNNIKKKRNNWIRKETNSTGFISLVTISANDMATFFAVVSCSVVRVHIVFFFFSQQFSIGEELLIIVCSSLCCCWCCCYCCYFQVREIFFSHILYISLDYLWSLFFFFRFNFLFFMWLLTLLEIVFHYEHCRLLNIKIIQVWELIIKKLLKKIYV